MENNERSLKEKVDIMFETLEAQGKKKIKIKKIKLPRKARVKKRGIKKGYIGILKIGENGHITGTKQIKEDFVYRLKDGSYHTSDGDEILFWEGKFPIVIQPSWTNNPLRIKKPEEGKTENETYGQKYIMAKMLKDAIPMKKKLGGGIVIWIILGIVGLVIATQVL